MTAPLPRTISVARRAAALYCAVHGRGAPLLLVHGFGVSGALFDPLLPALAARYQVIVPDLRGHGQSRRLPGPDSVARMAADLENLLDLLGTPPCFVLGYASGAAIALQFARSYPARVRGLVLACAHARGVATVREQIGSHLRSQLFRLLGARGVGLLAARACCPRGQPADDYAFVRDAFAASSGSRVALATRALLHFDSRPWLHELACPALVVAGEADTISSPQHARDLAARIPKAQLSLLPGAGHWLIKTHAGELAGNVLAWLAAQEVCA